MTTDAKAEAVGLEDVLAAHTRAERWCSCRLWIADARLSDMRRAEQHLLHLADQIRAHYAAALRGPEVEGKAARAIKETDDSGLPAIWARQYARAALAAAAESIGARRG